MVVAVLGNPSKSTGLFDRHLRERLVSASTIVRSPVDAGEVAAAASLVPEAVAAELWRWARDLSGSGADPSR